MRVTFDTNAIEKAASPERCDRDPLYPDYVKVHQAVADGRIEGFFSETIITLEGIQKADRAAVLGSTTMTQSGQITENPQTGETVVATTFTVSDPLRQPLHPQVEARIAAARALGMRLLKAPRIGGANINDPDGTIFVADADEAARNKRLQLYLSVLRELDKRGVGFAVVKQLAIDFAKRDNEQEPWFKSLNRANSVAEKKAAQRAVAEWADGDSIAAHIGYGIDYFCTGDAGKSAGAASVFNAANRAWLTATYGTKFITMTDLAAMA